MFLHFFWDVSPGNPGTQCRYRCLEPRAAGTEMWFTMVDHCSADL